MGVFRTGIRESGHGVEREERYLGTLDGGSISIKQQKPMKVRL